MKSTRYKLRPLALMIGLASLSSAHAAVDETEFAALQNEVAALKRSANPSSVVHLAGYGNVSYIDTEKANGSFGSVLFAPIFHYQINDRVMLKSELEIADAVSDGP